MSLSLSPNSLYRQTTDCTEGGSLTGEHCISITLYVYDICVGVYEELYVYDICVGVYEELYVYDICVGVYEELYVYDMCWCI